MSHAPLMRLTAWAIALTLVALPLVGLLNGWFAVERWPVRQLQIEAEFDNVSSEQIRAAAAQTYGVGFFALDLAAVQRSVAALPWVERVEARKRWPDTLVLRVYEQQPYAHWGSDRLVNRQGEIFTVSGAAALQGLPELSGPDDRLRDVLGFHAEVVRMVSGTGISVVGLQLSPRGSWELKLDSGARIVVGREHATEYLHRFFRVYPRVAAGHAGAFEYADLRYSNGFAMKWPPASAAPAADAPATETPDA